MTVYSRTKTYFLTLALIALAGCARGTGRMPVSGAVTFQGKPLETGQIQFILASNPPVPGGGAMIRDGRYEMPPAHGLEPGTYRVVITSPVKLAKVPPGTMTSPPTEERIPEKYSSYEHGDVRVEVTADGPNRFDFTID